MQKIEFKNFYKTGKNKRMPKFNAFKPGAIVHPGMFAGRIEELVSIEKSFFQTMNGNPSHFLIHGERGIGKSSLLYYIDHVCRGNITSLDDFQFAFLTVNIVLEPSDTYHRIIHKIARELQREIDNDEKFKKLLKDIWGFITNWEVMGVKYNRNASDIPPDQMIEELADKIAAICNKIAEKLSGIYIFIDEADKPSAEANLGEFAKIFTERLFRKGCNNAGIGIVGISNVLDKMRSSHESSVRIFTPYELKPLIFSERQDIVNRGIEQCNQKNPQPVKIEADALEFIATISDGYPHFIQQYAYSSFEQDTDNIIDIVDVRTALTKENGALHQLGMRYFENMYTGEINSADYRTVLQVMAQEKTLYVSRKLIKEKSGLQEHTLRNAITALTKRNIIITKPGEKGLYRLPSSSFAAWIQAYKI